MHKTTRIKNLYFSGRINEAMNKIFEHPLTIVEAPMGYGKSTAVREYLNQADAGMLWQRIHDSTTTSFWSGFCRLFGELDKRQAQSLLRLGFPSDSVSLQEALKLIEDIDIPEKTVLVIDDYHLVNGAEVNRFIEFLVVNEIINLHIVLIARFIRLPNLEELSLKGYIRHITQETFELMPQDIKAYYQLCGVGLKDFEADELYSYTEGWISALYLLMLSYKEDGSFITTANIYRLVEKAVYQPFHQDIKEFLLTICIFNSFTLEQAVHMWGNGKAERIIAEVTSKNAFVNYDVRTKTYQVHNIFTNFLKELLEKKDDSFKQDIYNKAAHWYLKTANYLTATHYYHTAKDYENLLRAVELDKGNSFGNEQKELFIKYFEECPDEIKQRHPVALLIYAMNLMTYNEMELFARVCGEFVLLMQSSSLDPESRSSLMGEFELLLSFTGYNDIIKMSEHHKKAGSLLKKPAVFIDTDGCWTFGSPSVLYMFHRESGKLEQAVQEIKEAMPHYYRLTNGHGMGAEHVMAAEWRFNQGDFENAEIALHKALYLANSHGQSEIVVCALFLQVRLSLMKGDYPYALYLFEKMHEEIEQRKMYTLIHTLDMCLGFVNASLKQTGRIPAWLAEGNFSSSRLLFPALAFSNIVYGRVLLIKGEYLKLLGIADQFNDIASVFPNLLANIYTNIYTAAANGRIYRSGEAVEALKQALDLAMPDRLLMPFVENCDYIGQVLDKLIPEERYHAAVVRIRELNDDYQGSMRRIIDEYLTDKRPRLTGRENEIAQLVVDGLTNKAIGERLHISPNTVKTQLKSIFEKLGVNSRVLLQQHLEMSS